MPVFVQPYLCLEFVHEVTGVSFGERYWSDPEYRRGQDILINRRLFDYFSRYWPAYASWYTGEPSYQVGVGAAYVIIAALFGGQIRYYENFHPDCSSEPLAWVTEPDQIRVPDVAATPPLRAYLAQYAELVARYGRERVALNGFISQSLFAPKYDGLAMHSPLTQAYKLRGMQLFSDFYERPALAKRLLEAVRDIYYQVFDLLIPLLGLKTDVIFFGACCSSLVSERIWRQWEMPVIAEICDHYSARPVVHSCGRSTHVLRPLYELPRLLEVHLGDATDLGLARRLRPEVGIYVVPDSVAWARLSPAAVRRSVCDMMEAAGSGPLGFQFVMEAGLPPANIQAVVEAVDDYNRTH